MTETRLRVKVPLVLKPRQDLESCPSLIRWRFVFEICFTSGGHSARTNTINLLLCMELRLGKSRPLTVFNLTIININISDINQH